MAEQTFRSPGFFENEIDLASRRVPNLGTPLGVIGTAEHGPAFVPVTVGSFADFETKFGTLDPERFGPYAVREFLKHRQSVTYMRVLGAGSNSTTAHVAATTNSGVVNAAGFQLAPNSTAKDSKGRTPGSVQFICASHTIAAASDIGFPSVYTDNDSFPNVREVNAYATATLTMADGDLATSGQFTEEEYVKLQSTDGTVRVYVLCDGSESGASATGTILTTGSDIGSGVLLSATAALGVCVAVQSNLNTHSQSNVLNEIKAAIEHANGHNGKITVSANTSGTDGGVRITLTQATLGTDGNTTPFLPSSVPKRESPVSPDVSLSSWL